MSFTQVIKVQINLPEPPSTKYSVFLLKYDFQYFLYTIVFIPCYMTICEENVDWRFWIHFDNDVSVSWKQFG